MASDPSPAPVPVGVVAGRVLANRYRLDHRIASGGMAQVWQAVDQVLTRDVAVKILHPHLAADVTFVTRFRAEAVAAARLAHPGIVAVYDTFGDAGVEAIVMELVRGSTLRTRLDADPPLSIADVVDIGVQAAEALGAAHRSGLVHRDVKPANILLSDDGRVLVADFGIAKAVEDADLTSEGMLLGTAKYISPEQVEDGPVDARTDVYALGVVLYEALTGEVPFQADSEAATALARLHRDPRPLRAVRPEVPAALEDVVLRALARSPERRFTDAASLRSALLAAGRAPHPPPPAPPAPHQWSTPPPAPRPPARAPAGTRARPRRRSALVASLIAASLLVAALLLSAGVPRDVLDGLGGDPDEGQPLPIATVRPFDPYGDNGRENDGRADRAVDGDPGSTWVTERYRDPTFGTKPGVGFVLALAGKATLRRLVVSSPTSGWAASVYVAGGALPTALDGWGRPVAAADDLRAGATTFDLANRRGGGVLLWITHLGRDGTVALADVEVEGSP